MEEKDNGGGSAAMNDLALILIGAVGMGAAVFLGTLFVKMVERTRRETEIQARLNRAHATVQRNESLLQQTMAENHQLATDLNWLKQICATSVEETLAYLEQTTPIFGDKKRDKVKQELQEVLRYLGRERQEPIALLEHILTNGADHEQSTING